ncbi:hypothetical protein ACDX78_01025 [Virgibacillus oceani]
MRNNKDKKEHKILNTEAPGIDPDDSFGNKANEKEVKKGESTRVTRLVYDEYEQTDG